MAFDLLAPFPVDTLVRIRVVLTELKEHELLLYNKQSVSTREQIPFIVSANERKIFVVDADLEAWQDPYLFTSYCRKSPLAPDFTTTKIQELTSSDGFDSCRRADTLGVHYCRLFRLSVCRIDGRKSALRTIGGNDSSTA